MERANCRPAFVVLGCLALITGGCSNAKRDLASDPSTRSQAGTTREVDTKDWIGVYSSTAESGGFSGTVFAIQPEFQSTKLEYRKTFYSDAHSADAIDEKEKSGQLLVEGDELFVPEASGYTHDGKVSLNAYIERYTRVSINGRTVLMRDDALKEYREHDRLYDYGILIKVDDKADLFTDLDKVKHESIKVLYKNPKKEWKDPFVNGPNER